MKTMWAAIKKHHVPCPSALIHIKSWHWHSRNCCENARVARCEPPPRAGAAAGISLATSFAGGVDIGALIWLKEVQGQAKIGSRQSR
jgi:hypothetical protein